MGLRTTPRKTVQVPLLPLRVAKLDALRIREILWSYAESNDHDDELTALGDRFCDAVESALKPRNVNL